MIKLDYLFLVALR